MAGRNKKPHENRRVEVEEKTQVSRRCSNSHLHTPFKDYTDGFPCFGSLPLTSKSNIINISSSLHSLQYVCKISYVKAIIDLHFIHFIKIVKIHRFDQNLMLTCER